MGKATAIAFAKEGIDVAITGRNEDKLKETVAELETFGIKAMYSIFDVGNYEDVKNNVKNIVKTLGTVDILVNNAGIAAIGSFNDMKIEQWSKIIQTNLMGMYYVTKEVLPYLLAKNEGDIFNVFHCRFKRKCQYISLFSFKICGYRHVGVLNERGSKKQYSS